MSAIGAIRVEHMDGGHTYWAFDLPEEFEEARQLVPHKTTVYHKVTKANTFARLTHAELDWEKLSNGLNEAEELRRCLEERGEI